MFRLIPIIASIVIAGGAMVASQGSLQGSASVNTILQNNQVMGMNDEPATDLFLKADVGLQDRQDVINSVEYSPPSDFQVSATLP